MEECRKLREEAAICRELAREIKDPPSVAMFLDRAEQLEARAAAIEADCARQGRGVERTARIRFVGSLLDADANH